MLGALRLDRVARDSRRDIGRTNLSLLSPLCLDRIADARTWRVLTRPITWLLNDIHHLTFITADMDRLIEFYERVFEARATLDLEEDGLRHAFIAVGPHTVLHPFQVPGVAPPGHQPMFQRGRLDHFALNAATADAFREVRRRLVAAGASDGVVTDMGSLLILTFTDPDGGSHEVVWAKPDVPVTRGIRRAEWTKVEMDT